MWTPGLQGAIVAVAAVAVAVLVVWGGIRAWQWLWPAGETLTLTMPRGGTIIGPGLQCGTRGSDCTTTRPTGEVVELDAQADDGYVFSGFTGDCAQTGRASMTQRRQCGATFDRVAAPPPAVTFKLTITKPMGGTVLGEQEVMCGTHGSECSADVPIGQHVSLSFQADNGWTFSQFTGDCPPDGVMTMTAAKTCGATFTQTSTPVANVVRSAPAGSPRPGSQKETTEVTKPSPTPQTPPPAESQPPVGPPVVESTPTNQGNPAEPPITAEQHARKAIERLVKNYCTALETLKEDRVKEWFPLAPQAELRERFRHYKSLKCTVAPKLDFELLVASAAGAARVKFEMKQVIQWRNKGGAPETLETTVTMNVSRKDLSSDWQIDFVRHEAKPKS